MNNLRAWDDEEKHMSYGRTEQFDDSLLFRFDHFETETPIYMRPTGRENIYESDIVGISYQRKNPRTKEIIPYTAEAVVKYNDADCRFELAVINSKVVLGFDRDFELVVIGNIYQNPELLKLPTEEQAYGTDCRNGTCE